MTSPWLWVFKQNIVSSSEAWPGGAGTEEQVLEGHVQLQRADLTATGGPGSACLREPYRGGDRSLVPGPLRQTEGVGMPWRYKGVERKEPGHQ